MNKETLPIMSIDSSPQIGTPCQLTVIRNNQREVLEFMPATSDDWDSLQRYEGRIYHEDSGVRRAVLMHYNKPTDSNSIGEVMIYLAR